MFFDFKRLASSVVDPDPPSKSVLGPVETDGLCQFQVPVVRYRYVCTGWDRVEVVIFLKLSTRGVRRLFLGWRCFLVRNIR